MERNTSTVSPAQSSTDKKLRLFGIDLDSSILETDKGFSADGGDESVNSSTAVTTEKSVAGESPECGAPPEMTKKKKKKKKFECRCCFKVFGNWQALGGHQNAHKNERLRKKSLQARNQPLHDRNIHKSNYNNMNSVNYYSGSDSAWCFDPSSSSRPTGFYISFCSDGPDENSRWRAETPDCFPIFQQDVVHKFSVTHGGRSREILSYEPPFPKKICGRKSLDLQLSLGL